MIPASKSYKVSSVHHGSSTHSVFYPISTRGYFLGGKAAGALS